MAKTVDVTIKAQDQSKAGFDSAHKHTEGFAAQITETLNKPFELLKGLLAIELVKVVGEFFKGSVEAAAESQAAWARVSAAVNNTGVSFRNVQGDLKETFAKVSEGTRFSEMQVSDAFATVLNVTNDYSGSIKNLGLIQNLAIAKQLDLGTAATIVGKAMEGQTTLLKRYGIIIKDGADAIDELNKRMRGFAEEDGKSLEGRLHMISKEYEEMKIALGEAITGSDTAAASAGKLVDALKGFTDWIEHNRGNIRGFIDDMGSLAAAIVQVKDVLTDPRGPIGYLIQKNTELRGPTDNEGDPSYWAALEQIRRRRHGDAETEKQIAANSAKAAAEAAERQSVKDEAAAAKRLAALKEQMAELIQGRELSMLSGKDLEKLGQLQFRLTEMVKDTNLPLKERLAIHAELAKIATEDAKRETETLARLLKMEELDKKGISLGALDAKGAHTTGEGRIDVRASVASITGQSQAGVHGADHSFLGDFASAGDQSAKKVEELTGRVQSLGSTLRNVTDGALMEFSSTWMTSIEGIINGHQRLGDAIVMSVRKAVGGSLMAKGQETLFDAAKSAAAGIWPPNPALLAQAAQLFGVGTAEVALGAAFGGGTGGSGYSGGSGGGGGGVSPAGFSQLQNQNGGQGKVTVVLKGNGINFSNPDELNALRDALQMLSGTRDLEFLVGGP